jgi:ribonuclease D
LEKVDFVYQEQEYLGVSGVKILPPLERGRFHALFDARNQLAEKLDRPPFMIISNKQLLDFAHSPLTLSQWRSLSRVHPEVRREANFFFSAVQSAKPEPLPERERKSFSPKQKDQIKALTEKRNCLAEKIQVKPHLLLSTEQIRQIILTGQGWKDWQKDVFNK